MLTTLLLPDTTGPHERWLAYPEVTTLAKFEGGHHAMPFVAADHWQSGSPRPYYPQRTPCRLVAVGNAAGMTELLRANWAELWHDLPTQLGVQLALPWPWTRTLRGAARYDAKAFETRVQRHERQCQETAAALRAQYRAPARLTQAASSTGQLWRMPPGWAPAHDPVAAAVAICTEGTPQPRYDWRLAYYTDGSVQATDDARLVGAAVYSANEDRAYRIQPNGTGPTNTINRAELAAIHHAVTQLLLPDQEGQIFTDSQVAIHLLGRAVREPHTLEGHLHQPLLTCTAEKLIERANAGVRTALQKVPAHSGIRGNEKADEAAKEAGLPDAMHDYTTPEDTPFAGQWRPAFHHPSPTGGTDEEPPRTATNLNKALSKAVHGHTKTGTSKLGLYATSTGRMYDGVDGDRALGRESNAALSAGLNAAAVRTVRKHRCGQWYHKKAAHKRGGRYLAGRPVGPFAADPFCPLGCGCHDGSTHLLLECLHRQIKAMQIARHHAAGLLIHASLKRHSTTGSAYTVLDVCGQAQLDANEAAGTRIPAWMLPEVDVDTLAKLRPDIMRVVGLSPTPTTEEIESACRRKDKCRIQILEVGYTMDTRWREAYKKKQEQHAELVRLLREAGWNVDEPYIFILGVCGAVYHSSHQALLALGLSKAHAAELLVALSKLAMQWAHDITCARRRLECERQGVG